MITESERMKPIVTITIQTDLDQAAVILAGFVGYELPISVTPPPLEKSEPAAEKKIRIYPRLRPTDEDIVRPVPKQKGRECAGCKQLKMYVREGGYCKDCKQSDKIIEKRQAEAHIDPDNDNVSPYEPLEEIPLPDYGSELQSSL